MRPRALLCAWMDLEGSDRMSVADLEELDEVKGLIARGLRVGVLTHAEVALARPISGSRKRKWRSCSAFGSGEIELVEELDPAMAAAEARACAREARRPQADVGG